MILQKALGYRPLSICAYTHTYIATSHQGDVQKTTGWQAPGEIGRRYGALDASFIIRVARMGRFGSSWWISTKKSPRLQAHGWLREGGQNTFAMALCTSSLDADTPRAIYLSADDMLLGSGLPSREPSIQALTKERGRGPLIRT